MQEIHLRAFLNIFGEISESSCEFTDVPDLLAPYKGYKIGIEHTRIYQKNPSLKSGRQRKPQEQIHFQIVDMAHSIFKQSSSISLWLVVQFTEPFDYWTKDIAAIANTLANTVRIAVANLPAVAESKPLLRVNSREFKRRGWPFPQGVDSILFAVESDPGMEVWGPSYGYTVPFLGVDELNGVIKDKDALVPKYRERCDAVWLLMVLDMGLPSSHFDITENVKEHIFETLFDRLFLFTESKSSLLELKTC